MTEINKIILQKIQLKFHDKVTISIINVWNLISYAAELLISEKYGRAGTKLVQEVQTHVDVHTFILFSCSCQRRMGELERVECL